MFDAHIHEAAKATVEQLLIDTGRVFTLEEAAKIFRAAAENWAATRADADADLFFYEKALEL